MNHHNYDYDGGSPNIPVAVGDRYYCQDLGRDFWFLLNESNNVKELFDSFPVLLTDGDISQGSDFQKIDIGIMKGFVNYEVNIPDNFSSIPPTVQAEDIASLVISTAQTDLDISATATLDGVSVNYVKLKYRETNGASRDRAKKAGNYNYERVPNFEFEIDTTAPTDYDIVIAEIVGDGSSFMTITNQSKSTILENTSVLAETITADKDYASDNLNKKIFIDVTAGDVTAGFFNGASAHGIVCDLTVIGSGNEALIELASSGVTDYTLKPGDRLTVLWDNINSEWVVYYVYSAPETVTADRDFEAEDLNRKILVDVTSGDVTLGLFNGANSDGVVFDIVAIGADNQAFVELAFNGITDYTLEPGDQITLVWDSGSSAWVVSLIRIDTKVKDADYVAPANNVDQIIFDKTAEGVSEITLPNVSKEGLILEIIAKNESRIIQADSENIIIYRDEYKTTKGVTGYFNLNRQDSVRMIYQGNINIPESSFQLLSNPAVPGGGSFAAEMAWSPDSEHIVVPSGAVFGIYKRTGDSLSLLTTPSPSPSVSQCSAYSGDGVYMAVGGQTSSFIYIYTRSGDVYTFSSNPSGGLPTAAVEAIALSSDGTYLCAVESGGGATSYVYLYKRTGSTFNRIATISPLPTVNCNDVLFSADDQFLVVAAGTGGLYIYSRSGDTFTRITPSQSPGQAQKTSFSKDGKYLAVTQGSATQNIWLYSISGSVFTRLSDLVPSAGTFGYGIDLSDNGLYLMSGHNATPYAAIFKRYGATFTQIGNMSSINTNQVRHLVFSPNSQYLLTSQITTAPLLGFYKTVSTAAKAWSILDLRADPDTEIPGMFN